MPFSFETLLDKYQAIQQTLTAKLQKKPYADVEPFWKDSPASYYNKRGGQRPFNFVDVQILLEGLHMDDELALVNLLVRCRQRLWEALHGIHPSKIRSLPLEESLINRLLLARAREADSWELEDLQVVISALGQLFEQLHYLLNLPTLLRNEEIKSES